MLGNAPCGGAARVVRKSSVSIGSVRLETGFWGTLATRLPFGFLSSVGAEFLARPSGELNYRELLRRATAWQPVG
jgi:hypothetical protein